MVGKPQKKNLAQVQRSSGKSLRHPRSVQTIHFPPNRGEREIDIEVKKICPSYGSIDEIIYNKYNMQHFEKTAKIIKIVRKSENVSGAKVCLSCRA